MTDTPNHPPSRTHATPPRLVTCTACDGTRTVRLGLPCQSCRYLDPTTGVRASFPFPGAEDTHATGNHHGGRFDTVDPAAVMARTVAAFQRETERLQGQVAEAYGVPEALQGRRSTDRNPADVRRGIAIGLAIAACVHVAVALVVGLVRWAP